MRKSLRGRRIVAVGTLVALLAATTAAPALAVGTDPVQAGLDVLTAQDGVPGAEAVIQDGRSCFYREDVSRLFPRERDYAAYLGMPIRASDGSVLGHLAFFDRAPRGDEMLVDSVYRIFLARAGAEMERARAGRGRR
jgi:GAF domain-containing protein